MLKIIFAVLFSFLVIGKEADAADKSSQEILGSGIKGSIESYKVGDIVVIAIKDTDTNMGKSIFLEPDAAIIKRLMSEGNVRSSINTFLIKTAKHNILVDTGIGGSGGATHDNLVYLGIDPSEIDIILITHMHNDHIGGLLFGKDKIYPKAKVYIAAPEIEFWQSRPSAIAANNVLAAYTQNIVPFEFANKALPLFAKGEGDDIEIKVMKAAGHTPGHSAFEVISKKEHLLIAGDIVHNITIQTAEPLMSVTFDTDPEEAAKTREEIFDYAQKNKIPIAGMHIPFGGIVSIQKNKQGGYDFTVVKTNEDAQQKGGEK
ncbi:MAG: MBL fold metallo-hydrolase [Elusimicrobiota bacterium]|jgi:glyoxylase-like metal-dependent hydrolase (beta-lactamase superfamily II)|nr:MBL fold metallo-hydrolase [Elusimicrobiota bacterium]